jgi:HD-GYP domain-containing protein (c-di-GMP phosphodiesterase class II)
MATVSEAQNSAIQKIPVGDMRVGMHVDRIIQTSWLRSPLITSNFKINSQDDIRNLLDYDIESVYIDFSKSATTTQGEPESTPSPAVRAFRVCEASLDDFMANQQVPVDVYQRNGGADYELVIKKGLVLSQEAVNILKSGGVSSVLYPWEQKPLFEQYRRDLEKLKAERKKSGYDGPFMDPAAAEAHVQFMNEYRPINPMALIPDTVIGFEIYARESSVVSIIFVKHSTMSVEVRAEWIGQNLNLLILKEDLAAYHNYLSNVARTSKDPESRLAIIRENSKIIVEGLAENPRSEKLMGQTIVAVQGMIHVVMDNPSAFYAIMKLNNYDYYTFTHSVNVATMSIALGLAAGMNGVKELADLALGSILHDIGKSQIDHSLINKPGTLTEDEYKSVTSHVMKGYEMLRGNPSISAQAMIPLLQHHEKLGGGGYPNGLSGDRIHLLGRIVSVIDVYDALTTERAYRKALKPFDALAILSKALNDYDKSLFATLVSMIHAQKA